MIKNKCTKILFLLALLVMSGWFFSSALAATENGNVTVGVTVPSVTPGMYCGDGSCNNGETCNSCRGDCGECPPPPPPTNYPPVISDVVSSTTETTAHVGWKATDSDGVVTGCTFSYGSLATAVVPGRSGSDFTINLTSLATSTRYDFTIQCTDDDEAGKVETGAFTTAAPIVIPTVLTIFDVQVKPGTATSGVLWSTNLAADSQVKYGLTDAYSGVGVYDPALIYTHSLMITNLCGNTSYHYQILSDNHAGLTANTADATFLTQADNTTPPNVSGFAVSTTSNKCALSWVNPGAGAEACLAGVEIIRQEDSEPSGLLDGVSVYSGVGQGHTDNSILVNKNYYYKIFTHDSSGNYSSGASVFCKIAYCGDSIVDVAGEECDAGAGNGPLPASCSSNCKLNAVVENCKNGVVDAGEDCEPGKAISRTCTAQNPAWNAGSVKCSDSCVFDYSGCSTIPVGGGCGDGNLNAGEECDNGTNNGACPKTCSASCKLQTCAVCGDGVKQGGEACDNGDLNGACPASCSTNCALNGSCVSGVRCGDGAVGAGEDCEVGMPIAKVCSDFNIEWSEGSVKCNTGCSFDTSDCRRGVTVPGFVHISIDDLLFWGGARNIPLNKDSAKVVHSLVGSALTIGVPYDKLAGPPNKVVLKIDGAEYELMFNREQKNYLVDVVFPNGGKTAYLEVDYGDGQIDSVQIKLSSLPLGVVRGADGGLENTKITLYRNNGEVFPGGNYSQLNPITTEKKGEFGWVVPNGTYYLVLEAGNYYTLQTQRFVVSNNVVNRQIKLTKKPTTIAQVIPANIERAVEVVKEALDNPVVEQAANQVVAPAAVGVVAVGTASLVSFSNLWAFLQLLFFQPILLLGKRKREHWGQVYNSLSKLPIDLAIVRLLDASTGKILRSRVTDKNGRFIFIAEPGKYRLEVFKTGYTCPTKLLIDYKTDGKRIDIYHGEAIAVTAADTTIAVNIPLDPAGEAKTPKRLRLERLLRHVQVLISWVGFFVTLAALYVSPKWYMWILLVVHVLLFLLFRRLARPPKPKGWGIVYDEHTKKPLDRAVARLFDSHFNKLVSTEITDKNGRYTFLAADSQFYVTYESPGYEQTKTSDIDLRGKDMSTIAVDVALKKHESNGPDKVSGSAPTNGPVELPK